MTNNLDAYTDIWFIFIFYPEFYEMNSIRNLLKLYTKCTQYKAVIFYRDVDPDFKQFHAKFFADD